MARQKKKSKSEQMTNSCNHRQHLVRIIQKQSNLY